MLITTAATRLRGVAGVHALHTNPALLSLVRYEGPESGKRSTMQPALSSVGPARCDARTDGGHVLHGKCGALWHAPDDALAHHVVMIAAAGRLARQAAQVALSALGPCGLERAPELEVPRFQVAPAALPMKAIVTGHGGAGHAQVHAPRHQWGLSAVWARLRRHADTSGRVSAVDQGHPSGPHPCSLHGETSRIRPVGRARGVAGRGETVRTDTIGSADIAADVAHWCGRGRDGAPVRRGDVPGRGCGGLGQKAFQDPEQIGHAFLLRDVPLPVGDGGCFSQLRDKHSERYAQPLTQVAYPCQVSARCARGYRTA